MNFKTSTVKFVFTLIYLYIFRCTIFIFYLFHYVSPLYQGYNRISWAGLGKLLIMYVVTKMWRFVMQIIYFKGEMFHLINHPVQFSYLSSLSRLDVEYTGPSLA